MKDKIVFIGCVKSKLDVKSKAKDLYVSPLFRGSLKYARSLTTEDNIFILSALYGLVPLNKEIEPYELTLNKMNKKDRTTWYNMVKEQMKEENIDFDNTAVFLTGKTYLEGLDDVFTTNEYPLEGLMLGERISFYNKRNA